MHTFSSISSCIDRQQHRAS